jgi:hypothetical protein
VCLQSLKSKRFCLCVKFGGAGAEDRDSGVTFASVFVRE